MEDALHRALVRARGAGEIAAHHKPRELARYLLCVLHGLAVVSKSGPSRGQIREITRSALSILE